MGPGIQNSWLDLASCTSMLGAASTSLSLSVSLFLLAGVQITQGSLQDLQQPGRVCSKKGEGTGH